MDFKKVLLSVENIPSHSIVYMRRTGQYGVENQQLMEQFKTWVSDYGLFNDDTVILGIALDNMENTAPQDCRYDVCLIVSVDFKISDEKIKQRIIDGGSYVIMQIPHTAEAVQEAWSKGLSNLIELGFQFDYSKSILERYAKKMVDNHFCEICVPITIK